ncbi:MAG: type II toxin-antitoxin system HicA family toxin [Deltaproteobacteria bacterium]|nr:type II toxin-antitoxin system HicA family toxin [Deltaproteobacteria bacterium]
MNKQDKLISKLLHLSLKKRELNTLLNQLGFSYRRGKGSHEVWTREKFVVTIATHDKEVPFYILKQLSQYLRENDLLEANHEKEDL